MKLMPTRVALSALVASVAIISAVLSGLPHARSIEGNPQRFMVKPYLQLGNKPGSSDSLELTWFTVQEGKWHVEYRTKGEEWRSSNVAVKRMEMMRRPLYRHTASLQKLVPGSRFHYKVFESNQVLLKSSAIARKTADQPSRFALFGDIGAATVGQKKVAYQCFLQKPDYVIMPGDIVYGFGLVSEYLSRFFPIMNGDVASAQLGAPLLRSTVAIPAIGNHDVAYTRNFVGTDMTRFPDALGYFIFWSMPLNGPNRQHESKNVPNLVGNQENQIKFTRSAGEKFPTMTNFSFNYGNCHWLVLDANPYMNWTDPKLCDWVEKDLAAAKSSTFKFVMFHQPGFSDDTVHKGEHRMRLLTKTFEKHNVDIVFAGHAHNYQRTLPFHFKIEEKDGKPLIGSTGAIPGKFAFDTKFDGKKNAKPNGIIYIVSGAGGAPLYGQAPGGANFIEKFISNVHSFTICDVTGSLLKVSQISEDGNVLDTFSIDKGVVLPEKVQPIKGSL